MVSPQGRILGGERVRFPGRTGGLRHLRPPAAVPRRQPEFSRHSDISGRDPRPCATRAPRRAFDRRSAARRRIERIEVGQGTKVAAGQLLAILEGHQQAGAQVALAEAEKARAIHQRSVQKQKLALDRERFDKLQKARNDQAVRVLASKALFDQITTSYKQIQPTLQGKDRLDAELKYLEAENQNIKDTLEVRSFQIAGELALRQRNLEDDELGEKSPDLDVLDRQIELARAGVAGTEVHAPSGGMVLEMLAHAGEASSGPAALAGGCLGNGGDRGSLPVRHPPAQSRRYRNGSGPGQIGRGTGDADWLDGRPQPDDECRSPGPSGSARRQGDDQPG